MLEFLKREKGEIPDRGDPPVILSSSLLLPGATVKSLERHGHGSVAFPCCSLALAPPRRIKELPHDHLLLLPLFFPSLPNPSRRFHGRDLTWTPPPHRRRPKAPRDQPSTSASSPRRLLPSARRNRSLEPRIDAIFSLFSGTAAAVFRASPPAPSLSGLAVSTTELRVSWRPSWTSPSSPSPPRSSCPC